MNFYARRFNLFLLAGLALALALACGCATSRKKDEPVGVVRVHIESKANSSAGGQTISVLRGTPLAVTIANEPVLNEANVVKADLYDTPGGGFAVEIRFDEMGTWALEQVTAMNVGRHLVIFGQWGKETKDGRWLAVPLITRRIGDGTLAFTPDMSREEAQKWVTGLNYYARKNKNGQ